MNKENLARHLRVTRQTLKNWQSTKPELYRLIYLGLESDLRYLKFFDLFNIQNNDFWEIHDFYQDFYFKFLNYFRQNITLDNFKRRNNVDITSSFIFFLIDNHQEDIFDPSLNVTDVDLHKFQRNEFKAPFCNVDDELSIYILKNTLDDFETLLVDTSIKSVNNQLFLNSLKIATMYLIFKFDNTLPWVDKTFMQGDILSEILQVPILKIKVEKIDKDEALKKYLNFRDKYTKENLDKIINELPLYENNNIYNPSFLTKLL